MIAVVTGGVRGLGLSFVEYLVSKGYKVYAFYKRSVDIALELTDKYDKVTAIRCDIANEEQVENTFFNIDDIDLLINNAAICIDNEYQDKTKKEFMKVLETNVVGSFLVTKNAISKMNKKGIIINISSNNALDNYSVYSMDYDASKAAVNMLTKDFGLVLNDIGKGQKIYSICPGWIEIDSVKEMNPDFLKEEMAKVGQSKLINPDELAKYVIDNKDKFNNGSIIEIKEL